MAENKKSFIIYTSWKRWLDGLNLEQKGMWLDWMLSYTNDEEPEFPKDQAVMIACMMAQDTLKRDLKKYEAKVESIQRARDKRKEDRNQIEINMKSDRNHAEINSVNVNVNDNVNVNVNDSSKEENKNNRDINISCSKRASIQTLFDTFWSAYPRKTGKDKCLNWFKSHKPDEALVQKMVNTITKFKNSKQWSDPQYIPYPYTWLNRGGWDDELDVRHNSFSSNPTIEVEWEELPPLTDEDYEKFDFKK